MTIPSTPEIWFALDITVDPAAAEAMEYALNSLEASGTEINHLRKSDIETVTVIGYFNALPEAETVRDEIHYALKAYSLTEASVKTIERREVENQDWLVEWKKHWKPTTVAGFIIAPPWEDVSDSEKIVISIEPNMAFGTGTHETTQLCLKAIDSRYRPGESFLDVGTGTGILAIAAARLNSGSDSGPRIYACDTDVDSVSIARDNAVLNGVGNAISFAIGSVDGETAVFDFVCANLTLDVILPNLQLLLTKAGRMLILSGILCTQESEIIEELAKCGITDTEVERAGEWIAVAIGRLTTA